MSFQKSYDLECTPGCVSPSSLDVTKERAAPSNCIFAVCKPVKTPTVQRYTYYREVLKAMIICEGSWAGFLTIGTIDNGGWVILCYWGPVLCSAGCLAASLDSTH